MPSFIRWNPEEKALKIHITYLKTGQRSCPTDGSTGAASTVLKGQLVTAEGVVIEVDIEGSGALVGVMGLPSDHPSGMEEDFQNLWGSIFGIRGIQKSGGKWSGEDLGRYQQNMGKESSAEGVPGLKGESKTVRPESVVAGSKKHGVKWKEGAARAKEKGKPQGQWAQSIVHMPDGSTQPATRMWIRNNGTGTWHGYPMQ